jgi:hypothetical protein
MSSDFSLLGRSARDLIAVPAVPLDAIHRRAHASRVRDRVLTAVACATISVGALGVGTGAAAKLYDGVRIRLFGDTAALTVHAGEIIHDPMPAELRTAIARATFPVVFPVGIPADVHVTSISVSSVEKPSMVSVAYEGNGGKFWLTLADAAIVDSDVAPGASGSGPVMKAAFHWAVGREVVLVGGGLGAGDVGRIKAAMASASPADSLASTEAIMPTLIVLGTPVRLDAAEHYQPVTGRGVLVGQNGMRVLWRMIARSAPLVDDRVWNISRLVYANGDIKSASMHKSHDVAIPVGGVRAVGAVLRRAGKDASPNACGCEILFTQPNANTYRIWMIPLAASPAAAVRAYAVDARTFAITP